MCFHPHNKLLMNYYAQDEKQFLIVQIQSL